MMTAFWCLQPKGGHSPGEGPALAQRAADKGGAGLATTVPAEAGGAPAIAPSLAGADPDRGPWGALAPGSAAGERRQRARSALGATPRTWWSVMHSVSTPRGRQCPQPQKTAGTCRPLERGVDVNFVMYRHMTAACSFVPLVTHWGRLA